MVVVMSWLVKGVDGTSCGTVYGSLLVFAWGLRTAVKLLSQDGQPLDKVGTANHMEAVLTTRIPYSVFPFIFPYPLEGVGHKIEIPVLSPLIIF
jgi:hypothetical protein